MTPRDRRMLAAAERLAAAILADRQACAAYNAARATTEDQDRGPLMSAAVATQRRAAVEVGWAHEEIVRTSRLRPRWKADTGERQP